MPAAVLTGENGGPLERVQGPGQEVKEQSTRDHEADEEYIAA